MRVLGRKPLVSGSLRGFLDLEVKVENDRPLQILECPILVGSNGPWVAMLAKPQIDREGNLRRKPGLLRWGDHESGDAFSRAAIKLLLAIHPDALTDVEATA